MNPWTEDKVVPIVSSADSTKLIVWLRFMQSMETLGVFSSYDIDIDWHVKTPGGYKSIYLFVDGYQWRLD